MSGRGAAWLARLLGVQEVPGSNPGGPTKLLKHFPASPVFETSCWSPFGVHFPDSNRCSGWRQKTPSSLRRSLLPENPTIRPSKPDNLAHLSSSVPASACASIVQHSVRVARTPRAVATKVRDTLHAMRRRGRRRDCAEGVFQGNSRCGHCNGTGINVKINSAQPECPHCKGTGVCATCGGSGLAG